MTTTKSSMRYDWRDAIRKRDREQRCRVCGETRGLEIAHIIGRKHDAILTGPKGGQYRYVHPDSVVPLCGAFTDNFCHGAYDRRELDLLPYLHVHEQSRAVEDAGGVLSMLGRVSGPNG